ncbi:MAG: HD domain-containing protein [Zestosphaera sp.]
MPQGDEAVRCLHPLVKEFVKGVLGSDWAHGYPHVQRVLKLSHEIAAHMNLEIDLNVLECAALLHDVGRVLGEPHAYFSAVVADGLLRGLGVSERVIEVVENAILYHSYSYASTHGIQPVSEEAKVLSDADKLDALGVIGFVRVFLYGHEHGVDFKGSVKHFREKILNLHTYMHYNHSREKALKLTRRVETLLKFLEEELGYTPEE